MILIRYDMRFSEIMDDASVETTNNYDGEGACDALRKWLEGESEGRTTRSMSWNNPQFEPDPR